MKVKDMAPMLLLALIWGCYYVASQQAVSYMSVFTVGVIIRIITFCLLTARILLRHEIDDLIHVKGIWPKLLLIGCLGFLLDLTAFIGLSLTSAGSGTALLKCDILFINLISVLIYKHKFSVLEWLYTFVMLFGVMLVMGIDLKEFRIGNIGNVFFILSALFVSINAFVIKSVQLDKQNPAKDDVVAYYNNVVAMILFIVTACGTKTIGQIITLKNNPSLMSTLLSAGIGQTLVFMVYYYNLRRYPVWLVKVFLLLMPVVAAVLGYVLFSDTMNLMQFAGMIVVLAGALGILMEQKQKRRKNERNLKEG